jgi:hypothetical protein
MTETVRNMEPEGFAENRYRNFHFTRESIVDNAPVCSGVYGLYNALWIYIGEAENIQHKLLEHLANDTHESWNGHYRPSGFAFEIVPAEDRGRRQRELLHELQPLAQRNDGRRKSG